MIQRHSTASPPDKKQENKQPETGQPKVNYQYKDEPPPPAEVMEEADAKAAAKDEAEAVDISDYSGNTPEMAPLAIKQIFPETVYEFIKYTAAAQQVDPVMVALPVLSAMAACVGTSRVLRVNEAGWKEYACLWTVILAHSGSNKSAGHEMAVRPIVEADQQLIEEYEKALDDWEKEKSEAEKSNGPIPPPPNPNRLCVKNVTVEQISAILAKNPKGLLLQRNELSGWLESFTKYTGSTNQDEWLDFYNAVGGTIDRKTKNSEGKNTVCLKQPLVSITGTSQPVVLEKLLGVQSWSSGLAPRLIIAAPPRKLVPYRHPPAGREHYENYRYCITKVLDDLSGTFAELTLSPEADHIWIEDLHRRQSREYQTPEGSSRSSQLAKIRSLSLRWALVHFVFSQVMKGKPAFDCQIDKESMTAGVFLADWVERESARVVGILAKAPNEGVENIWLKTIVGAGQDGIDAGSFQRNHRSKKRPDYLENIEQAKATLARFVAKGWVQVFDWKPPRGPVQQRYRVFGSLL